VEIADVNKARRKCKNDGCLNKLQELKGCEYCSNHKCQVKVCGEQSVEASDYCSKHKDANDRKREIDELKQRAADKKDDNDRLRKDCGVLSKLLKDKKEEVEQSCGKEGTQAKLRDKVEELMAELSKRDDEDEISRLKEEKKRLDAELRGVWASLEELQPESRVWEQNARNEQARAKRLANKYHEALRSSANTSESGSEGWRRAPGSYYP